MSVVAIESLVCPRMASHCSYASYLEYARPELKFKEGRKENVEGKLNKLK